MKYDTHRTYEMNVTEEEMKTIISFCNFLEMVIDYRDDYREIYDITNAIVYGKDDVLKGMNVKINIGEEN